MENNSKSIIHTPEYFVITTILSIAIMIAFFCFFPELLTLLIAEVIKSSSLLSLFPKTAATQLYTAGMELRVIASILVFILSRFIFDYIPAVILHTALFIRAVIQKIRSLLIHNRVAKALPSLENAPIIPAKVYLPNPSKGSITYEHKGIQTDEPTQKP